jgi:predicted nucleic acid-binding Zn ribbon protein
MKQLGLDNQHWLEMMSDEWPGIVGADVAKHTRLGGFQNKNLTIFVDGSVWLNELVRYGRDKMLASLQKRFGADRITTVTLRLDPGR